MAVVKNATVNWKALRSELLKAVDHARSEVEMDRLSKENDKLRAENRELREWQDDHERRCHADPSEVTELETSLARALSDRAELERRLVLVTQVPSSGRKPKDPKPSLTREEWSEIGRDALAAYKKASKD